MQTTTDEACWVPECHSQVKPELDVCYEHLALEIEADQFESVSTDGPGYVERLETAVERKPITLEPPRFNPGELADRYGKAALLGALDDFEAALQAGEGRNNAINALAFRFGQLTREGKVEGTQALDRLAELAESLLPDERWKTRHTIATAFRDGLRG